MNKDIPDRSKNSHRKFRLIDMLFLILIIGAITSIVGIYLTEKEGKMTYEQKQLLQNSTPERSKKRHREYSTSVGNYQYRGIVDMSLTESEYTYPLYLDLLYLQCCIVKIMLCCNCKI